MTADYRKDAPQHGGVKHQETELHARKGYETLDAQAGATYRAGAYILGAMFLAAAVAMPIFWLLARGETREQPAAATVIREQPAAATPSFPRLVTAEPLVLSQFRAQEDLVLNGYGWVEKDRGIARIPVAEAMRIVGQRGGLPSFPPPAGAAAPAASSPPSSGAATSGREPGAAR